MFKYISLILLLACSSSHFKTHKKVEFGTSFIDTSSFYQMIPFKKKIVQLVEYKDSKRSEKAQVVITKDKVVKISVLSLLGVEILALEMNEDEAKTLSRLPGVKVDFFYRVMADMLAVYAEKKLLLKSIGEKIQIVDTDLNRKFYEQEKLLFDIKYSDRNRWGGEVKIFSTHPKYNLLIKTLAYENLY